MAEPMMITEEQAKKVLEVVDAGLVHGLGNPIPGQMCVEGAVCYAFGLPHSDKPEICVAELLQRLGWRLNDARWSSMEARTKGLRRFSVAQLGTAGVLNEKVFVSKVAELAIRKYVPIALRAAARLSKEPHAATLERAAHRCEAEGTAAAYADAAAAAYDAAAAYADAAAAYADADAYAAAASAAYAAAAAYADADAYAAAAAYADADAARDSRLSMFAEDVVQVLVEMGAPGAQWLPLTE